MYTGCLPQRNIRFESVSLFEKAHLRASLRRVWAKVLHRDTELALLENAFDCASLLNGFDDGLKSVPIERIRGTMARKQDFDAQFRPLNETNRTRWMNIAMKKILGHELPPVELIQVGNEYYVCDGHHRISVSRALGEKYIDARVKVLILQPK